MRLVITSLALITWLTACSAANSPDDVGKDPAAYVGSSGSDTGGSGGAVTGGASSGTGGQTGGTGGSDTGGAGGSDTGGAGGSDTGGAGGSDTGGTGGTDTGGTGGTNTGGAGGTLPEPDLTPCGTQYCADDDPAIVMGAMRILQNEWTDPATDTCTFFNCDGTFGWIWNRGSTGSGDNPNYPNYPEVEFGINPWNDEAVDESTTTLLPEQLKNIHSAKMIADFDSTGVYGGHNTAFEMWFTENNPATDPPGRVVAEIMVFFAWHDGYWPTDPCCAHDVKQSAGSNYVLYHSADDWGTWGIYRQYRREAGSQHQFNGTLDIKPFLEGFNGDWWVTRFEIGNEIYQNSGGTTTFKSLCFEVNGTTECAQNQ